MKIILFYDNFVRDYRGLLLLYEILNTMGHKIRLHALWNNAIQLIEEIKPDIIVMGHIAEFTTGRIGYYAHENQVRVVLNTTENVTYKDRLPNIFRYNFREQNEKYIAFQVITSRTQKEYIRNCSLIRNKKKYKYIGYPRFDLTVSAHFKNLEDNYIKRKYCLEKYNKIYLYISSFIFDDEGGQISKENEKDINLRGRIEKENYYKNNHLTILKRLLSEYLAENDVLLIKKHPWDKSSFIEDNFEGLKNCIIIKNFEYLLPIINNADFILHLRNTSIIEAWLREKKTISITPDFDGDRETLSDHMTHEVIVKTYNELIEAIENYPAPIPGSIALLNYEPYLDGAATIRLAKEINNLATIKKKSEPILNRGKSTARSVKLKIKRISTAFKYDLEKVDKFSYEYNYRLWETKKKEVDKLYKPAIKKYIKEKMNEIIC